MVKLSKNRGGTGSVSYSISISGKEATRAGLVDDNGDSYDLEKLVDTSNGHLIIRRSYIDDSTKYVSRVFIENKDVLLSGSPVLDNKNVLYWIDGDILYEKLVDKDSPKKPIAKREGDTFIPV